MNSQMAALDTLLEGQLLLYTYALILNKTTGWFSHC